jgi:predicted DNA-binding transcriptional regulator AlpA
MSIEEKLIQILEKLEELKKDVEILKFEKESKKFTNIKEVTDYLNISKTTLYNMIKDNRLKESVHYIKSNKKRYNITFIESAIIDYKRVNYENI